MRVFKTLSTASLLALLLVPRAAHSQLRRFPSDQGTRRASTSTDSDVPADTRALLGIAVGTSGTDRDTLGLLVTQVLRDGPGDRAGIDEGNRLAEIDGVSLRLDPADVGRSSATDVVMRRLTRALRGMQSGEQATLRIFGAGKFRNVNVQLGSAAGASTIATAPVTVPTPTPPPTTLTLPTHASSSGGASSVSDLTMPRSTGGTVDGVVQALGDLQAQLRRLSDDEATPAFSDSLAQMARDLGALQRRLRTAQADQRRRSEDSGALLMRRGTTSSGNDVPGLSLSAVSDDLSDYFGDGSDRGLLVLQADASWSPIRNGDVILTVDGAQVTASRLRDAHDARQPVRIELLRRRRQMTVTLNGRE
jgi:hypothetical protein